MRIRYKAPASTGILELQDDATLRDLFQKLEIATGLRHFTIKYGPPMAMQQLDANKRDLFAECIGLHGQSLTIVPKDPGVAKAKTGNHTSETSLQQNQADSNGVSAEARNTSSLSVAWPEREGTLCESCPLSWHLQTS